MRKEQRADPAALSARSHVLMTTIHHNVVLMLASHECMQSQSGCDCRVMGSKAQQLS